MSSSKLDWKKMGGLVPAVVQHARTRKVLMLGFMDQKALQKTLATKKVWFYSRTKKRLWKKGETSGHVLDLVSLEADCDCDTLLIQALPNGPVCHTGSPTCFERDGRRFSLEELFCLIRDRKKERPENSYTSFLFSKGLKKICEKVAEESGEVIRAASRETRKRLVEESVDVLYHLFVLLAEKNVFWEDLTREISRRHKN